MPPFSKKCEEIPLDSGRGFALRWGYKEIRSRKRKGIPRFREAVDGANCWKGYLAALSRDAAPKQVGFLSQQGWNHGRQSFVP